jgi:hypothetical protein
MFEGHPRFRLLVFLHCSSSSNRIPSLSLFTPEDLRQATETGELDPGANLLDLRPDPVHFTQFLESIDRPEISSELFVKFLEAYWELKMQAESDPMRWVE